LLHDNQKNTPLALLNIMTVFPKSENSFKELIFTGCPRYLRGLRSTDIPQITKEYCFGLFAIIRLKIQK